MPAPSGLFYAQTMLPLIPQDKANHAIYGAALACAGLIAHSPLAGLIVCAAFAVGKEVYDQVSKKGTPDLMDAVATVVGGLLVVGPWFLP